MQQTVLWEQYCQIVLLSALWTRPCFIKGTQLCFVCRRRPAERRAALPVQVTEMLAEVDADGSGEVEFPEVRGARIDWCLHFHMDYASR